MAERVFCTTGCDVALVQEPYMSGYQRMRLQGAENGVKAEIWVKSNIDVTVLLQHTTANFVTVRVNLDVPIYITSVYDEPGGNRNARLEETNWPRGSRERHLIGGDFNAHISAWGQDDDDMRGAKILDWSIEHGYSIWNVLDMGPTFQNTRGQSFIDLTLTRGLEVEEWRVEDDETLSGHKYLTYSVVVPAKRKCVKKVYDFEATDWNLFKPWRLSAFDSR